MSDYKYPDSDDQITKDFINENFSNDYWVESEQNALKQVFNYIDKNSCDMLDLGCGTGRLFNYFSNHVHSITGVEPDYERYQASLEETKKFNNIMVINGSIQNVKDNYYDFIFISHVFQHIPVQIGNEIIDGIRQILKPNGILAITTTYSEKDDNLFIITPKDQHRDVDYTVTEKDLNTGEKNEFDFYVRDYSYQTIQKLFENDFEIEKKMGFHYLGNDSIEQDNINNQEDNLKQAVDVLYILKRKEKRLN